MNIIFHFLLSYIVIDSVFGNALDYIIYILILSIIVDLDRILYIFKVKKKLLHERLGSESRSRFYQFYGRLISFSLGISVFSLFSDIILVKIIALSIILHYATDFLLGRTGFSCPFSRKEVLLWDDIGSNLGRGARRDTRFEPSKPKYVRRMRAATDYIFLKMPLPKINPNVISGLSVLTSLFFLSSLKYSSALAFILATITLLLDWFDGLVAKKHNLCSEQGYLVDVTSDRLSEGIMFIPFFMPWYYLFVLNSILTVISVTRKKHTILPLRFVFLICFLALRQI